MKTSRISGHARGYCELIREHIRIEDEYFYRLADQLMTHAERQSILEAFSAGAADRLTAAERDRFLGMLDQYPGIVAGWK